MGSLNSEVLKALRITASNLHSSSPRPTTRNERKTCIARELEAENKSVKGASQIRAGTTDMAPAAVVKRRRQTGSFSHTSYRLKYQSQNAPGSSEARTINKRLSPALGAILFGLFCFSLVYRLRCEPLTLTGTAGCRICKRVAILR